MRYFKKKAETDLGVKVKIGLTAGMPKETVSNLSKVKAKASPPTLSTMGKIK